MAKNRDNCVILMVAPPEQDKIPATLQTAFGPERAGHLSGDLITQAYKTLKNFPNAILLLSYEKTLHHPDLTWLDPEDPGFLEFKSKPLDERIHDVFQLAFFTGAKKTLLIDYLSPEIKEDWLARAFEALNDKTVALGANEDGTFYLLGLTQQNLKILEAPGFTAGKSAELLTERIQKNKLAIFNSPDTYSVNSEDSLRKWLENRETAPSLSSHITDAPAGKTSRLPTPHQEADHKKHGKKHTRNHEESPAAPQQENTPPS